MSANERRRAVATWLLEISALLAVFPVLDQVVSPVPFNWALTWIAIAFVLITLTSGILLIRGEK